MNESSHYSFRSLQATAWSCLQEVKMERRLAGNPANDPDFRDSLIDQATSGIGAFENQIRILHKRRVDEPDTDISDAQLAAGNMLMNLLALSVEMGLDLHLALAERRAQVDRAGYVAQAVNG